jgi:peptidoglycan/xylan/chitin deacetylase (PgdA/CDA1 family)
MTQRLCIGIQELTLEWEIILSDLGVWFEEVIYSDNLVTDYSLIILNKEPSRVHFLQLKTYLESGGSILELKGNHSFIDKNELQHSFKKTCINHSDHPGFDHIPFLDLYSEVETHRHSSLFDGLLHFKTYEKGCIGFIGGDIAKLLQSTEYRRKRFYVQGLSLPDEIVSAVSKHELMDIFSSTLAELHFKRELPFIHKWTSPDHKPVFCFRIDSDFGDKASVQDLYNILDTHNIEATWFLHTEAHEDWLSDFKALKGQEIALHGYKHGTSKDLNKIHANIKQGSKLLESEELEIDGFCAPYGIWNEGLERALSNFNFSYTSEFTFKYDGLPSYVAGTKEHLQIPVHPICTGSLNRRNYTEAEMIDYFKQVFGYKSARFEPVIFYHHPLQPGLDVIDYILGKIVQEEYVNLTFSQFAQFWSSRSEQIFEAVIIDGELQIQAEKESEELLFSVANDHNGFSLLKAQKGLINLKNHPKYDYSKRYLPNPQEIENMRKIDLRLIKTSLLDWKNRIRL